ncbi:hypothetical protein NXK88_002660 [Enterococcus hirae]|uniref:hypothetical protein n=1 Tax=Enterococcus hirae TaxID=1354 RepID=UPI0020739C8F|nr:hypothetical protein [Enterococcus hirae]EMF0203392.1 hypothetical protein [Enterococcus hirae]
MKNYKTIFGKEIHGNIINDKYENIVVICDQTGTFHVVHKLDVSDFCYNKGIKFDLFNCQMIDK